MDVGMGWAWPIGEQHDEESVPACGARRLQVIVAALARGVVVILDLSSSPLVSTL